MKPLLAKLNFILNDKVLIKRCSLGIISAQDLYGFGYSSFKKLTRKFLENEGYSNITSARVKNLSDVNFICTNRIHETYVQCILDDLIETDDWEYSPIGRTQIQQLLGRMVHDNVKKGVIITNGHFSSEAEEFANRLCNDYQIILINGLTFTKYLSILKESDNFNGGFLYE